MICDVKEGNTALLWASSKGSPEIIHALLQAEANPYVANRKKILPIHMCRYVQVVLDKFARAPHSRIL